MHESENPEIFRLRILDASINRASEGLRVVEDFTRMGLEDAFLSSQLKNLRHDLTAAIGPLDAVSRVQSRESEIDVGRSISTDAEQQRADIMALIASNMARVQQAFRAIEEYCKSHHGQIAQQVEQLRYRAYTLEKAIISTAFNVQRLDQVQLYVLVDGCDGDVQKLGALVSSLASAGVNFIQLRDKTLSDRELVASGNVVRDAIANTSCRWVMNDRADLAVATGAHGVHLGQDDITVHAARKILGSGKIIGVSTHSIEQAHQAVIDGADYIGVGPTFASQTKSFTEFPGLDLVRAVTDQLSIPAFAIGGVDLTNVDQVISCGCVRIAVASAVSRRDDPAAAATSLLHRLTQTSKRRQKADESG